MPIFMFTDSHSEDSEDDVIGDIIEIEDDKDTSLPNATSDDNNNVRLQNQCLNKSLKKEPPHELHHMSVMIAINYSSLLQLY